MRPTAALCLSLALAAPALLPAPALAQEDDRGYLTAFLEDNLSGAGRKVTVTGFAGALSSQATIEKLTIADDRGIWLTLDNVVLDWSRSALLSGEVVVNELTADRIVLDRLPDPAPQDGLPAPEATPFALPDLPVSIDIGEIAAKSIVLGAPVLGEPIEATLTASMKLVEGDGMASFLLQRVDSGPAAKIALEATYANSTSKLTLDLDAQEEAGGIVARMLDLPGAPAAGLSLQGEGTLDDFAAAFLLESDGEERLAGPITLKTDPAGNRSFLADLAGNPAPLFLPEYAAFLGNRLTLDVQGTRFADGRLDLERLDLGAQALRLSGKLSLAADGLPQLIDVTGSILAPDGTPVLLPIPGEIQTRVGKADLALRFDAAQGSAWQGHVTVLALDRSDLAVRTLALTGAGTIDRLTGMPGVDGGLGFAAAGLAAADKALAAALGTEITGNATFDWRAGENGLQLPRFEIKGADYAATAALTVDGLDSALQTKGWIALQTTDLSRFSALAGRPLGGAGDVRIDGTVTPLSGAFDLTLDVKGQGLKTGIPQADQMLAGASTIAASVKRDETGLTLRSLTAAAKTLKLSAQGTVSSAGNDLKGHLAWGSLADLGGGLGGSLDADVTFRGTPQDAAITLTGAGQALRIGQPEVDRLIAGRATLTAAADLKAGEVMIKSVELTAPNLAATIAGAGTDGTLRVTGRIRDLALLAPQFPGPLTLTGTVRPTGSAVRADLRLSGPAGIDTRLNGTLGERPDITLSGTASAAVANGFTEPVTLGGALRYDLALRGGWTPAHLGGRVTLSGGRIAIPARGLSLDRVAVAADLAGGSVRLTMTADTARGGGLRVAGPVSLTAPYSAGLDIRLDRIRLRDPELYETVIDGALSLSGPLLGRAQLSGQIALGETELRVPSTGFATGADLELVRNINDSASVRATRDRAGVGATAGSGTGSGGGASAPDWGVNLTIGAPNRIFVRGRGLDAELGGTIYLGGTLNALIPSGGLQLIRGRLDILGKRLTLSQATLNLEGDFVPDLIVRATNTTDDVTSIVSITGPATAPVVTFSSDPEMAQEEVLAWLLFGRGLDTISAFQAAQLASAVATLAGRGGEGIVGRLRKGFGLDDLDFQTDASGSASLSAGKYISEKVYTEVSVGQDGNTRINLNLDVRPGVTVKGRVDSDGDSGIGVYLEKDY
ncbi:MAG: translocation/assembly module TamB domain-containing protein [Rhodobacteraceae bacterium]|jgi:translocation and assembly module TamB|nr:translocation/assembly module TamB domain-containing protein [Paracoccaceae bacterium]